MQIYKNFQRTLDESIWVILLLQVLYKYTQTSQETQLFPARRTIGSYHSIFLTLVGFYTVKLVQETAACSIKLQNRCNS